MHDLFRPSIVMLLTAACVATIASWSTTVEAYNILMLPVVGKSHVFSMVAMSESLAARGHSVTVVVGKTFPLDVPEAEAGRRKGVYYERSEDNIEDYDVMFENLTMTMLENKLRMDDILPFMKEKSAETCRHLILDNEALFERLAAAKFDLAVVDGIFIMKCVYLIPHRLKLPIVSYSDALDPVIARVPWLTSFVPTILTTYTERMTFVERLKNTALTLAFSMFNPIEDSPKEVFQDYQRYGSFKTLDDLMAKTLLWLIPKDHILDYPKPTMPHTVNIGGLTVKRSVGTLPADLLSFIEGARSGVIVVSFGSMAPSFPRHIIEKFFAAFERLDSQGYRVIWRLKSSKSVSIPANVLTLNWLPQNDLLGHASTKLFITHCGNNGQYEAINHGVPMIGFPLAGDQEHNAARLMYKGYGVSMNIHDFTADELFTNIQFVLNDGTHAARTKRASEIFRSNPTSPGDLAAHWIEHVARFGGDHLRSAGQDLPLYSYLMLDIIAFVLVVVVVVTYFVLRLVRFARRLLTRRPDSSASGKLKTK